MENINLVQLLNVFVSDKKTVWEIREENIDVINYFIENKSYKSYIEIIKSIILDSFYSEITSEDLYDLLDINDNYNEDYIKNIIEKLKQENINWNTINELIEKIEKYDETLYIDSLIDLYDKNLINSLYYFWTNLEINSNDIWKYMSDLIKKHQYELYVEFFEMIRCKFITFLENIKN